MANYSISLDPIFHALSDVTRRDVLKKLAHGPASVGELAKGVSMALPSFLKHLKVLDQSGLISSEKKGRVRVCELRTENLQAAEDWLQQQRQLWIDHTDRLESYIYSLEDD
jgi:DNA-binding transcriptional ArsR family regulator